jgi:acylphosphatase
VRIDGRVQGVGFRWYCREQAVKRGLAGFVRNTPEGAVEAAFEGEPSAVEAVLDWCRRGPSSADVDSVDVREEDPTGDREFRITR